MPGVGIAMPGIDPEPSAAAAIAGRNRATAPEPTNVANPASTPRLVMRSSGICSPGVVRTDGSRWV